MSISYPLSLPTVRGASSVEMEVASQVGYSRSPFTAGAQVYVWPNELWRAQVNLVPMLRADAEQWVAAFLLALNGMEGSFLMGQPGYTTPQGTWSGASPLGNGAVAAGVKTFSIDGLSAGATGKAGDYFQLGSGGSSRLHKLTKDFTANGAGQATIDFTPRTRVAYSDNEPLVLSSPKGLWMLDPGQRSRWSIGQAMVYGLSFECIEDLRDL